MLEFLVLCEFDIIITIDEPTILVSDSHAPTKPPVGKQWPQQFRPADEPAKGGAPLWYKQQAEIKYLRSRKQLYLDPIIKSFRGGGLGEVPFSKGASPSKSKQIRTYTIT